MVTEPIGTAVDAIGLAHERVLGRIAGAAARAGREPSDVRLIAVTKTVPVERVRAAIAVGLVELGENRVREGVDKRPLAPGASWYLIGPLQSNKVRRAIETFDAIQSIDSLELASRVARVAGELRAGRPLPVLLQVNVDVDPAKAGFREPDLARDLPAILALHELRVDGLMTIGRLVAQPDLARPTFAALRDLSARMRAANPTLGSELSMGMSDDFEVAVEEGATIVRVGRALFGARE